MAKLGRRLKSRLYFWLLFSLSICLGVGIILYNLSGNISYFVTPSELIANNITKEVKLGGYVKEGSIVRLDIDEIEFEITDRKNHVKNQVKVKYKGAVPLIFRDNQGVVASGSMDPNGVFIAKYILAKHDEKYRPK